MNLDSSQDRATVEILQLRLQKAALVYASRVGKDSDNEYHAWHELALSAAEFGRFVAETHYWRRAMENLPTIDQP